MITRQSVRNAQESLRNGHPVMVYDLPSAVSGARVLRIAGRRAGGATVRLFSGQLAVVSEAGRLTDGQRDL